MLGVWRDTAHDHSMFTGHDIRRCPTNKVWVSTCKDLRIQFTVFHLVKPFGKKIAGDSTVLGLVERRSIKTWIGSCLKRSCTP